jgi:hypothetical protein
MTPASGIPSKKCLQFHILRRCPKYVDKSTSATQSDDMPPQIQPPAPSASSTRREPGLTAVVPPASPVSSSTRRPRPVVCKKRPGDLNLTICSMFSYFILGTCNHIVAFGDHYDKKAWAIYEKHINGQHAIMDVPSE